MGDLRNRQRKEADRSRIQAMQVAMDARRLKREIPRCRCGLTYMEAPAFWAVSGGRLDLVKFYCPACLPAAHRALIQ
jgi:hypothetical protein